MTDSNEVRGIINFDPERRNSRPNGRRVSFGKKVIREIGGTHQIEYESELSSDTINHFSFAKDQNRKPNTKQSFSDDDDDVDYNSREQINNNFGKKRGSNNVIIENKEFDFPPHYQEKKQIDPEKIKRRKEDNFFSKMMSFEGGFNRRKKDPVIKPFKNDYVPTFDNDSDDNEFKPQFTAIGVKEGKKINPRDIEEPPRINNIEVAVINTKKIISEEKNDSNNNFLSFSSINSSKRKSVSDELKDDLTNILKKSIGDSVSKQKVRSIKKEYDKIIHSGKKNNLSLDIISDIEKESLNFMDNSFSDGKGSHLFQNVLGSNTKAAQKISTKPDKIENFDIKSNLSEDFHNQSESNSFQVDNKRKSKSIMDYVVDRNQILQKSDDNDALKVFNLVKKNNSRDIELDNNILNDDSSQISKSIVSEVPKTAIEKVDFIQNKRARSSYFPEKISQKVKMENDGGKEDSLEKINLQIKGPMFDLYSRAANNTRVSDFFKRASEQVKSEDGFKHMKNELDEFVKEKFSRIQNTEIETLANFKDSMERHTEDNKLSIGLSDSEFFDDPSNFTADNFEVLVKDTFKRKILQ